MNSKIIIYSWVDLVSFNIYEIIYKYKKKRINDIDIGILYMNERQYQEQKLPCCEVWLAWPTR